MMYSIEISYVDGVGSPEGDKMLASPQLFNIFVDIMMRFNL